ncbi:MAG: hypothetical protein ACXWR0_11315 [Bdellovibrio sp.]
MIFDKTIIDNNLLRRITQIGKYDLYEKYVVQLVRRKLIEIPSAKLFFTPAGVLEYLGQKIPIIETAKSEYYHSKAAEIIANPKVDASAISRLRADLLEDFEATMRRQNLYSKGNLVRWINLRKANTEPKIHELVFDIIERNFLNGKARSIIYNRVALDRTFLFPWEQSFSSYVNSAYLAELHQAFDLGLTLGSTRALSNVWKEFSGEITNTVEYEKAVKAGTVKKLGLIQPKLTFNQGVLSPAQTVQNIHAVTSRVAFKEDGDFTDVEAIHALCVGRFFNDECHPILFSTQDKFGDLIVRIALFKSFYKVSYEMVNDDESATPPKREGIALQFDHDVNLRYEIRVSEVDPLLHVIGNIKIEEWIEEKKKQFQV